MFTAPRALRPILHRFGAAFVTLAASELANAVLERKTSLAVVHSELPSNEEEP